MAKSNEELRRQMEDARQRFMESVGLVDGQNSDVPHLYALPGSGEPEGTVLGVYIDPVKEAEKFEKNQADIAEFEKTLSPEQNELWQEYKRSHEELYGNPQETFFPPQGLQRGIDPEILQGLETEFEFSDYFKAAAETSPGELSTNIFANAAQKLMEPDRTQNLEIVQGQNSSYDGAPPVKIPSYEG